MASSGWDMCGAGTDILFPVWTPEVHVMSSLQWLCSQSVKTELSEFSKENHLILNSATRGGEKVYWAANQYSWALNWEMQCFLWGWNYNWLSWVLMSWAFEPSNLWAVFVSLAALFLWLWALFQWCTPAVFSKSCLAMQLQRQDTSHVAACLLQLPCRPANDKQKSFV